MSDPIEFEPKALEKRLHTRHRAKTQVYITGKDIKRTLCTAVNLSASGVGILTESMGLRVGTIVNLIFVINLGKLQKLHRRVAEVRHIHNGITGMHMRYTETKNVQ